MMDGDYRNYGIDIARILSMFMVVLIHNLLNGGVLRFDNYGITNLSYWLLENLAIVAVNLFAMISGFLLVDRHWKVKKIFSLWKVVLFWSFTVTFLTMLVLHDSNWIGLIKSFFPLFFEEYWYFNAYVVLFLFIPFLNLGIVNIDKRSFNIIVLTLLILSATVGFKGSLFEENGYSGLWLMVMYLVGAWIKKIGRSLK